MNRKIAVQRSILVVTLLALGVFACATQSPEGSDEGAPSMAVAGSAPVSGGVAGTGAIAGMAAGGASNGGASSGASNGGAPGAGAPTSGAGNGGLAGGGLSGGGVPPGGADAGGATTAGTSSGGNANAGAGASGSSGRGGSSGAGGAPGGAGGRGGAAGAGGSNGSVCTGPAPARAVTIWVIGDSTASVYAADLYPRMGWGQPLGDLFAAPCAVVQDRALSGRSSKSFIDEGSWTPVKNALQSGDYVLIQFAHNDEKSDDPARYTEPQTTFKQYLTTYITDARAKQATPLLLTPINRNQWSGTTVSNSHGAYPAAMRELAQSLQVELVDLTAITKTYFERIGQTATSGLFLILAAGASPNYPDGVTDNTHLQERGARTIGQLFVYDAYRQRLRVSTFLKAVPVAP